MDAKPKCIIVTGRQGSGKTTLARKLGERLRMPAIVRDDIKEGYVNTFGVRHDELPTDANGQVTERFFGLVNEYLRAQVSIVIEAAFQHHVWETRTGPIFELASPLLVHCVISDETAFRRPIDRGLADPEREFYHGDHRVVHYKQTGEILTPAPYDPPRFDIPTIEVNTDSGYTPSFEEIVDRIRSTPT